jgi:hypothetical protein
MLDDVLIENKRKSLQFVKELKKDNQELIRILKYKDEKIKVLEKSNASQTNTIANLENQID